MEIKDSEKWLEEYWELMFGPNQTEETLARAAVLKYKHMPERLYKYRYFCSNHLSALGHGVLYAAPLNPLNDIRESNIVLSDKAYERFLQTAYNEIRKGHPFLPTAVIKCPGDIVRIVEMFFRERAKANGNSKEMPLEIIQSLIQETEKESQQLMERYIHSIRKPYSACSLSATKTDDQMWGYYADSHKGFCIEYDFKSLGIDNIITSLLFPVLYVDDSRVIVDNVDDINGKLSMLAATQKNRKKWAYEEEWRILYESEEANIPHPMPKPTAIYIGQWTDEKNTKLMMEFCSKNHIPIFRWYTIKNLTAWNRIQYKKRIFMCRRY